jgi:hypothetical protein
LQAQFEEHLAKRSIPDGSLLWVTISPGIVAKPKAGCGV